MSKSNQCFLVGNLGSDPVERNRTEKGPIVGLSVAENVQVFDQATKTFKTTHTNWFNVTAFGSIAERAVKGLKKGDRVAVQGRMKVYKYKDKAGEEKNGFEIIAEDVALWKSLPGSGGAGTVAGEQDESLPF